MNNFNESFLNEMKEIISKINPFEIENLVEKISYFKLNKNGRMFFCGSGGGAGHASHAAADFRKLLNIESYSITDNVSELTARINDDGWETSYAEYLKASRVNKNDSIFVFSVGGGSTELNISVQLINAAKLVKESGGMVFSITGRDGGEILKLSDGHILIPTVNENSVTAHTEGLQAYMWHFLVSHPDLDPNIPKWEGVKK